MTGNSSDQTKCNSITWANENMRAHKSLLRVFTHTVLMPHITDGMKWHFWFFFIMEVTKFFHFCIFPIIKLSMSTAGKMLIQLQKFYLGVTMFLYFWNISFSKSVLSFFFIFIFIGPILVKFGLYLKISSIPPKMRFFIFKCLKEQSDK